MREGGSLTSLGSLPAAVFFLAPRDAQIVVRAMVGSNSLLKKTLGGSISATRRVMPLRGAKSSEREKDYPDYQTSISGSRLGGDQRPNPRQVVASFSAAPLLSGGVHRLMDGPPVAARGSYCHGLNEPGRLPLPRRGASPDRRGQGLGRKH